MGNVCAGRLISHYMESMFMELVFESRRNISNVTGSVHFVQWRPRIHQEPVVQPDTFVDGLGVLGYGTVLNDGGRFRLWYQAIPKDWPGMCDIAAVAYAESDDGYEWKKKPLGLVDHGPGKNHLCDLALHSPSVFIDPDAPDSHRYRATGCGRDGFLARPGIKKGYHTAHSADGLHWELDSPEPRWAGIDVITSMYHPQRRAGVIAMKHVPWVNRMRRRVIHTAGFRDGSYTDDVTALYPDEFDDISAASRGHATGDYYGMAMLPAGQSTVGFIWNFWHDLPYSHLYPYGAHGHSDITLVYQEKEGDRWLHVPGRPDFISHHDLPWSQLGWIYSSSTPVQVGDEHRLYFSASNFEHMRFRGPDGMPVPKWEKWIQEHGFSAMTFASWPRFRLFGFETPAEASFDITLPCSKGPVALDLNFKTHPHGSVRVSRRGHDQYDVQNCIPLTGDSTSQRVCWKHGQEIFPDEKSDITVTIHLERAAVYAYQITCLS